MDQQAAACAVPPGFRFHPTEEELVGYYLARKVASQKIDLDIIREVDLYRIEPWDLQARCSYYGGGPDAAAAAAEEPTEYYFFSYKDRKYPSGTRTNRATAAGFWKATGRDKPVLSSGAACRPSSGGGGVIGMRKTLVFYRGRAPNGRKTDWIIHEYRLQNNEHAPAQEEGWVVCRAFQKPVPSQQQRHQQQQQHGGYYAGGYPPPGAAYYYYDGSCPAGPAAAAANGGAQDAAARLLMMSSASADDHGRLHQLQQLAEESKLQVQLLADMPPPLQSPAVDGSMSIIAAAQSYDDAAAAAESSSSATLDWNLLSSLLPPSSAQQQLAAGFHHQQPASPSSSSCRPSNNNI